MDVLSRLLNASLRTVISDFKTTAVITLLLPQERKGVVILFYNYSTFMHICIFRLINSCALFVSCKLYTYIYIYCLLIFVLDLC